MDSQSFSEWLTSLSFSGRTRALALVYSALTVYTRELFLPDRIKGKEQTVLHMLHGMNEMHHTLANWFVRHSADESEVQVLSQMLAEIGKQYRIEPYITEAIKFARSRDWSVT